MPARTEPQTAVLVLAAVDTSGHNVVENPGYGTEVLILLLGDQQGVTAGSGRQLLAGPGGAA